MFKHLFRLAFALGLLAACASAQTRAPQFKDYPVREVFRGRNAPLRLTKDDRMFRTRLREASKEKPNFAGHYVVTYWGCGTECVYGAVVDVRAGRVAAWFPGSICCWLTVGDMQVDDNFEPVIYRLDSSLIVFAGARDEKEGDVATHFYKLVNGRLVHVASIPKEKAKQ